MKKLVTLAFAALSAVVILGAWIQSDNGIAGYTNSIGENNCTNCHSGNTLNASGGAITMTSTMSNWQYVPGATYTINIKVKRTGLVIFGVDAELLTVNDTANAGTIVITNSTTTQIKTKTVLGKSRNNFAHKSNGGLANDSAIFSFNWNAPLTNVGNVKLYVAGVCGNNNNSESGDWVYTANQTITPAVTTFSISGTVFNDANGATDNIVNGVGTNAGSLYANLLNAGNNVVATALLPPSGIYSFSGLNAAAYTVQLSTNVGIVGSPAPVKALPAGYVNTGEFIGTGVGNDGTANGLLPVTVTTANIINANFGVDRLPVSNALTVASQSNPGTTVKVVLPALSGTDAEDGALGSGKSVKILSLPTNGKLYYNNVLATLNQVITGYNPALLAVDPNNGTITLTFTYSFIDAAGLASAAAATVSIPFKAVTLTVTPLALTTFTATTTVPSAAQSFTISGNNLLDSVKITAPAKFQVSLSATTGWKTTFKLPKDGTNKLPLTTIYVRYKPTALAHDSGSVTCISLGATTKKVTVVGNCTARMENSEDVMQTEVSIAPNPVANELNILNFQSENNVTVNIYDISGKLVQTEQLSNTNLVVNVSALTKGIYICNIDDGTKVAIKRFVKE